MEVGIDSVRSPVKAPPPDKGEVVLMFRVLGTGVKPRAVCLSLKIVQSAEASRTLVVEVAEGRLKGQVAEEEEIVKSVPVVELAKVMTFCLAFQVPEEEI